MFRVDDADRGATIWDGDTGDSGEWGSGGDSGRGGGDADEAGDDSRDSGGWVICDDDGANCAGSKNGRRGYFWELLGNITTRVGGGSASAVSHDEASILGLIFAGKSAIMEVVTKDSGGVILIMPPRKFLNGVIW